MLGLTLVGAALIAAPTEIWLLGATPAVIVAVNAVGTMIVLSLYLLAARQADHGRLKLVGLFSGLLGGFLIQLGWHVGHAANLATAFSAYASFGSTLYRLDVFKPWWPLAFVSMMGLFYMGIALALSHMAPRPKIGVQTDRTPTMSWPIDHSDA